MGREKRGSRLVNRNMRKHFKSHEPKTLFLIHLTLIKRAPIMQLELQPMTNLQIFLRQIRARSRENKEAMQLLATARLAGSMSAILRQELDSMVRVIYLLGQASPRREHLIEAAVKGEKWSKPGLHVRVTDRDMINFSQKLNGWTESVYKFGCAFIHLSNFHDYANRDPIAQLSAQEQKDMLDHCRYYHGGPSQDHPDFNCFVPYLPRVFDKISSNLDYYLVSLEEGRSLEQDDL